MGEIAQILAVIFGIVMVYSFIWGALSYQSALLYENHVLTCEQKIQLYEDYNKVALKEKVLKCYEKMIP